MRNTCASSGPVRASAPLRCGRGRELNAVRLCGWARIKRGTTRSANAIGARTGIPNLTFLNSADKRTVSSSWQIVFEKHGCARPLPCPSRRRATGKMAAHVPYSRWMRRARMPRPMFFAGDGLWPRRRGSPSERGQAIPCGNHEYRQAPLLRSNPTHGQQLQRINAPRTHVGATGRPIRQHGPAITVPRTAGPGRSIAR